MLSKSLLTQNKYRIDSLKNNVLAMVQVMKMVAGMGGA